MASPSNWVWSAQHHNYYMVAYDVNGQLARETSLENHRALISRQETQLITGQIKCTNQRLLSLRKFDGLTMVLSPIGNLDTSKGSIDITPSLASLATTERILHANAVPLDSSR